MTAAAEVYAVGREVTLVLDNCELSAGRSVTSATLELTDPDGTPVPGATFTAPARVEPSSGIYLAYESTVTFTPTRPGQHHLLLSFEPGAAVLQRDLLVATDRSDAGPVETMQTTDCAHYERTPKGGVLCRRADGVTLFRRGPTQHAVFQPTVLVRAAGDVVWTVETGSVKRYLDTGVGGLVQTAVGGGNDYGVTGAATEQELLVVSGISARVHRFDGGQLLGLVSSLDFTETPPVPLAAAFDGDAGTLLLASGRGWVRTQLVPGASTPTLSWNDAGVPVHEASDGLWMVQDGVYRFVPLDAAKAGASFLAPQNWRHGAPAANKLGLGERPVLIGHDTSDGTTTPTYDRARPGRALVPNGTGVDAQLELYDVGAGAALEATQGRLRAGIVGGEGFWPL